MLNEIAYLQVADNLRQLPIRVEHDPYCFCDSPHDCPKKCKTIVPTSESLYPLKALAEVKKEDFKKILKQSLRPKKEDKNDFFFLTINPKPDITLSQFLNKIQKTLKSNLFADHLAVIEQRGNSDLTCGQGLHAHILFKRITPLNEGLPPSNIKRNLRESYKKICLSSNNQIFNQQFVSRELALDKFNYIIGQNKTGEGKKEKQNYDKIYRSQNNLPEYYGNIDILN